MSYVIAGRVIKSEYLAISTLLTAAGAAALAMSGGKKEASASTASSGPAPEQGTANLSDEDAFIRNFVAEAEKEDKKH